MALLDVFKSLFGRLDYGKVNPQDLDAALLLDLRIDGARRAGAAALEALLSEYGLKNSSHWEKIKEDVVGRNASNPDYPAALQRAAAEYSKLLMSSAMKGPPG